MSFTVSIVYHPCRRLLHPCRPISALQPDTITLRLLQNWVFMYVSALIAWWRPGGSTCLSAAAVAVRGRTGSAGANTTSHAARGAVAQAGAARGVRAATEGTFRRDFAKGVSKGFNIYTRLGFVTYQ